VVHVEGLAHEGQLLREGRPLFFYNEVRGDVLLFVQAQQVVFELGHGLDLAVDVLAPVAVGAVPPEKIGLARRSLEVLVQVRLRLNVLGAVRK
jgi:hypothetical protein